MFEFIAGVIVGVLLSSLAVLAGKKFEVEINQPYEVLTNKKAEIISKKVDPFEGII